MISETICWKCENAVPNADGTRGCSWSRSLTPVKGWKTKKRYVHCTKGMTHNEDVIECPEFILDEYLREKEK